MVDDNSGDERGGIGASVWVTVRETALPDRKYFKIGEVAQLVGVEPHVLRYWQTQFPQVRPQKSRSGHRLYRKKDVETLLAIRELLHVQRFTIAGARQALRSISKSAGTKTARTTSARRRPRSPAPPANLEVHALDDNELPAAYEAELIEQRGGAHVAVDVEEGPELLAVNVKKPSAPDLPPHAREELLAARDELREVLRLIDRKMTASAGIA